MRTDRFTKLLLVLIALALSLIAVNPWLRPMPVSASTTAVSFDCTGELKANAWGGVQSSIGGYKVSISCE